MDFFKLNMTLLLPLCISMYCLVRDHLSILPWYKSIHVPSGIQRIITLEVYIITLTIKDSFVLLDIIPHTDNAFETLPHVHITSEL
jgi:hypothetical protein